jgi:hypothetical protein
MEDTQATLEARNGQWTRALENCFLHAHWAANDARERFAQIDGEIEEARLRMHEVTLLEDTNKHKGVQCVTKAQKAVELNERRLRDERERRLGIFAECLQGNDTTHHSLQASVQSLHDAGVGREVDAVVSRLRVWILLQIAHNSGTTRQQRRTTDKLRRSYVARFTRVVTKSLPEAVAKAGNDKFLEHNVEFPARSPHSRA